MNINLDHLWSRSEDDIVAHLRNTTELSIREISKGLFNRSKSSVAGRILILRRNRRII